MIQKTKEFINEVKVETKKVSFPSREELIGSTWVVIVTVLVMSIFLGFVDIGLSKIIRTVIK